MGYILAMGTCYNCGEVFSFNPDKVPSLRVEGVRQPICKTCIDTANIIRKEKGLPPLTYAADAYSFASEGEEEDGAAYARSEGLEDKIG